MGKRVGREPAHLQVPMIENAMAGFKEAASIRPEGDDESTLRWHRCARLMQNLPPAKEQEEAVGLYVPHGAPVA